MMSDNKRGKKNLNKPRRKDADQEFIDSKRPIILAKKCDPGEGPCRNIQEKPKILLKPKEATPTPPVQISIATRPPTEAVTEDVKDPLRKSQPKVLCSNRESKDFPTQNEQINTNIQTMKKPIQIISDNYQLNSQSFDNLIETNTDFYVVGIIGTQGSGKSTIMNWLIDDGKNENWFDDGVFETKNSKKFNFSNKPITEGIQMYVTRERTILLDSTPVLFNPHKKFSVLNELDDLKIMIFLLNICHTLIIVEDRGFNLNLIRLIQCAENMQLETDPLNKYSPNIIIFRNKCSNNDFLSDKYKQNQKVYSEILKNSKLKIRERIIDGFENDASLVNIIQFPFVNKNKKSNVYSPHPGIDLLITQFQQKVFMSPRNLFPAQNQQSFTEKLWSHLAMAVWESHKNNYFLRKYETFKEKEWSSGI